jgi:hypothetical protein
MDKYHNELASALLQNKVFAYAADKENRYESIENLLYVLGKARTGSYNTYELVIAMDRFARIYELFRPNRITHEDHYFGTVAMMDNCYGTMYGIMKIHPLHRFSKVDGYPYHEPGSLLPEDMAWDGLIADLNYVKNAVIRTINQKALEAYVETGLLIPRVIEQYIRNFIRHYNSGITDDQIEFVSAGIIKIKNEETEIRDIHDFSEYISQL